MARIGVRSRRANSSATTACQAAWYGRAAGSTNVRTAWRVSQSGDQAKRTARGRPARPRSGWSCPKDTLLSESLAGGCGTSDHRSMEATGRIRGPYRAAFGVREFRAIFVAATVTTTGSVVSAVALTVLVYTRTGSPFLSSLTFALGFLPYLVGGTLLSGIVDRVPPRRLLVTLDLTSVVLTASMAIPSLPTAGLLILLCCNSTLTSLTTGTRGGLVRAIVPADSYVPARSLLRIASQTAQIVGNAVGGALLVVLTPQGAILVNAGSYLVSACITRIGLRRHPAVGPGEGGALLRDSLRGVRRILADRPLRRLLLFGWLIPMCAVAPEALAAPYVAGKGAGPVF